MGGKKEGRKVKRKGEMNEGREKKEGVVGRKDGRTCGREEMNEQRKDGRKRRDGRKGRMNKRRKKEGRQE